MFKRLSISILLGLLFYSGFSQNKITINKSCSYYGEKTPTNVYTFSSDGEAQSILNMILSASGLSSNFKLVAGNVPNAVAVILLNSKTKEPERYIIYNQTFMYNIEKRINYWASVSILAHEIGHHLNGHSLMPGGSRPSLELEADKFSGFVLATLGANLEDAQAAINNLVSEEGSLTHPPKSARLAAIANGWYENNKSKSSNESTNSKKYNIGQRIGDNGIIVYLDNTGSHGLIAFDNRVWATTKRAVGTWSEAVSACNHLGNTWRLPSKDELNLMRLNKNILKKESQYDALGNPISNEDDGIYWSSTQRSNNSSWVIDFSNGEQTCQEMNYFFGIKAIRSF